MSFDVALYKPWKRNKIITQINHKIHRKKQTHTHAHVFWEDHVFQIVEISIGFSSFFRLVVAFSENFPRPRFRFEFDRKPSSIVTCIWRQRRGNPARLQVTRFCMPSFISGPNIRRSRLLVAFKAARGESLHKSHCCKR